MCNGSVYVHYESLTFVYYKTCLFDGKALQRAMLFYNKKHEMRRLHNHKIVFNMDGDTKLVQSNCVTILSKKIFISVGLPLNTQHRYFVNFKCYAKICIKCLYVFQRVYCFCAANVKCGQLLLYVLSFLVLQKYL